MSMKLSTAKVNSEILLAMKINRLSDKEVKATLTKDYLALRKVVKEVDNDREELSKKFREDWAEELLKPDKSDAYKKALEEANAAIMALYDREADVSLDPVPSGVMFDTELWGEDNTLGQIANSVDLLIVNGIAKE